MDSNEKMYYHTSQDQNVENQQSPPPSYQPTIYSTHHPIIYQPTVYETRQHQPYAIETHLGWSLLNTICCLCVGTMVLFCSIPALVFSFKTQQHIRNGNFSEAQTNSKLAHIFNSLATFLWVMIMILGLFMVVFYTGLLSAVFINALDDLNLTNGSLANNTEIITS